MTTYAWTLATPNHFAMRALPNSRVFSSPLTKQTQSIDMIGERWCGAIGLAPTDDDTEAGAREAFFDRLKGPANLFSIYHFRRPVPNGTFRDGVTAAVQNSTPATVTVQNSSLATVTVQSQGPSVREVPLQYASTVAFNNPPGRTVQPGDMIGVVDGTQKQLCRAMAAATADSNGRIEVEVMPRPRWSFSLTSTVTWNMPTVDVMLRSADGVPMAHTPDATEGVMFEFIEA